LANKGIDLERKVINLFRDNGWSVIRGAGSKGEVFGMKADLVATYDTGQNIEQAVMVVIQCKKNLKKKVKPIE
jgi:Holliday junction resolvase